MSPRLRPRRLARLAPFAVFALAACLEEPAPTPTGPPSGEGPDPAIPARVLVLNTFSETLSSYDLATGAMTVQAATVGASPNRLGSWPEGFAVLVTCSGENAIRILNNSDLSFRQEIDLGPGSNPWLAVPTGSTAASGVVTNWLANEVRSVNLGEARALGAVPVPPGPEGVAIAAGLAWIACTNFQGAENEYGPGRLAVVDLATGTIVETLDVGQNPQDVLLASDGRVHVLCTGTYGGGSPPAAGRVHVFDPVTRTESGTVDLGGSPGRFVEDPDGVVWVAGFTGGIRRYEAATLALQPDPVSPELAATGWFALDADPNTGTIWAVNFDLDLLAEIAPEDGAIREVWIVGDGPVDVLVVRP